jgi:hypothetical protein
VVGGGVVLVVGVVLVGVVLVLVEVPVLVVGFSVVLGGFSVVEVVFTSVVWAWAGTITERRTGFVQDFGSTNVEAAAAPTVAVTLSISLRSERGATGPRRSRRRIMTKRRHRAESGFMRVPRWKRCAGNYSYHTRTRKGKPNKRDAPFSGKRCRFASVCVPQLEAPTNERRSCHTMGWPARPFEPSLGPRRAKVSSLVAECRGHAAVARGVAGHITLVDAFA